MSALLASVTAALRSCCASLAVTTGSAWWLDDEAAGAAVVAHDADTARTVMAIEAGGSTNLRAAG
jgi:hypothetical protein